jgi:hypothetical protein
MSKNENDPDDIRPFDHIPGSPFYQDPDEWMVETSYIKALK